MLYHNHILYILLHLYRGKEPGEIFFLATMQTIVLGIAIYFWNKRQQKKHLKKRIKDVQKNIVKDSISCRTIFLDYSNLYDDLKEKCNPVNFLNPYNAKKVEISNSIYSQLDENRNNISQLINLRNLAITELNIKFSSQELFDTLSSIFNPNNFVNENYDSVKLYSANKIYSQILKHKDNIIELEKIAEENNIEISIRKNTTTIKETNTKDEEEPDLVIYKIAIGIVLAILVVSVILGII